MLPSKCSGTRPAAAATVTVTGLLASTFAVTSLRSGVGWLTKQADLWSIYTALWRYYELLLWNQLWIILGALAGDFKPLLSILGETFLYNFVGLKSSFSVKEIFKFCNLVISNFVGDNRRVLALLLPFILITTDSSLCFLRSSFILTKTV